MYDVWTQPQHFAKWMGPTGSKMEFIRTEIVENGTSFYKMTTDTGMVMFGKIKYLKFNKPNTIIYTQQFSDENENLSRHPLAPVWPATMLTTITLEEEPDNSTRVTVKWEPCDHFTEEELLAFIEAKAGMTIGWTGSFDKLEDYISTF